MYSKPFSALAVCCSLFVSSCALTCAQSVSGAPSAPHTAQSMLRVSSVHAAVQVHAADCTLFSVSVSAASAGVTVPSVMVSASKLLHTCFFITFLPIVLSWIAAVRHRHLCPLAAFGCANHLLYVNNLHDSIIHYFGRNVQKIFPRRAIF